jgi:hypothetical protein
VFATSRACTEHPIGVWPERAIRCPALGRMRNHELNAILHTRRRRESQTPTEAVRVPNARVPRGAVGPKRAAGSSFVGVTRSLETADASSGPSAPDHRTTRRVLGEALTGDRVDGRGASRHARLCALERQRVVEARRRRARDDPVVVSTVEVLEVSGSEKQPGSARAMTAFQTLRSAAVPDIPRSQLSRDSPSLLRSQHPA